MAHKYISIKYVSNLLALRSLDVKAFKATALAMSLSETAGFFFSLEDAGEPHTRSVMNGDDSRQLRLPPL